MRQPFPEHTPTLHAREHEVDRGEVGQKHEEEEGGFLPLSCTVRGPGPGRTRRRGEGVTEEGHRGSSTRHTGGGVPPPFVPDVSLRWDGLESGVRAHGRVRGVDVSGHTTTQCLGWFGSIRPFPFGSIHPFRCTERVRDPGEGSTQGSLGQILEALGEVPW